MSDEDSEETPFDIASVGLPDEKALGIVESVRRVWTDGDNNGVVLLRVIDGSCMLEIEMYPNDAQSLSRLLADHANRATTLTSPHLQAFNG